MFSLGRQNRRSKMQSSQNSKQQQHKHQDPSSSVSRKRSLMLSGPRWSLPAVVLSRSSSSNRRQQHRHQHRQQPQRHPGDHEDDGSVPYSTTSFLLLVVQVGSTLVFACLFLILMAHFQSVLRLSVDDNSDINNDLAVSGHLASLSSNGNDMQGQRIDLGRRRRQPAAAAAKDGTKLTKQERADIMAQQPYNRPRVVPKPLMMEFLDPVLGEEKESKKHHTDDEQKQSVDPFLSDLPKFLNVFSIPELLHPYLPHMIHQQAIQPLPSAPSSTNATTTAAESVSKSSTHDAAAVWQAATLLKQAFAQNYGGPVVSRALLQRAWYVPPDERRKQQMHQEPIVTAWDTSLLRWAQQWSATTPTTLSLTSAHPPLSFVIWVLGDSAAAGYGTATFSRSYAQQLMVHVNTTSSNRKNQTNNEWQHLLEIADLDLQVHHIAMQDATAFPMLWCMDTWMGDGNAATTTPLPPPDMVIWDFSARTILASSQAAQLEAAMRNMLSRCQRHHNNNNKTNSDMPRTVFSNMPLWIFRGGISPQQAEILQAYIGAIPVLRIIMTHEAYAVDVILTKLQQRAQHDQKPYHHHHQVGLTAIPKIPAGLQSWYVADRGGATTGAASADPVLADLLSTQQHDLVAWLIKMHIAAALQWWSARQVLLLDVQHEDANTSKCLQMMHRMEEMFFVKGSDSAFDMPLPITLQEAEDSVWGSLLLHPYLQSSDSVVCATTYEIASRHSDLSLDRTAGSRPLAMSNLPQLIMPLASAHDNTTATTPLPTVVGSPADWLLPKTAAMWHHQGWVWDLDANTRRVKLRTRHTQPDAFGGFPDWKAALYGIPQSGPIRFFLPIVRSSTSSSEAANESFLSMQASSYVKSLLVCESDATALRSPASSDDSSSCRLVRDAVFKIQGQVVTAEPVASQAVSVNVIPAGSKTQQHHATTLYPCVSIPIPVGATLSRRPTNATAIKTNRTVFNTATANDSVMTKVSIPPSTNGQEDHTHQRDTLATTEHGVLVHNASTSSLPTTRVEEIDYGIRLTIQVVAKRVTWKTGPCSIAQLIWLRHDPVLDSNNQTQIPAPDNE